MKRSNAKKEFERHTILSNREFEILEKNFDRRRLYEWQKKGYILQIKKGYYILNKDITTNNNLFMIANKIYTPSYISLESALSYYNIIPEGVFTITSITSKTTRTYNSKIGKISFFHIKKNLFTGYVSKKNENYKYNIATIEKTIFDFLYLRHRYNTKEDFEGLRINTDILKTIRNKSILIKYGKLSNNKACQQRIKRFISFVEQNA